MAGKYKDPEYMKKYKEANKDKMRSYDKKYRDNNKEVVSERKKDAYSKNREHYLNKAKNYRKERKLIDPVYKLYFNVANMIRLSIKENGFSKKSRTHDILGCSYEEFKIYLESKFESWMNWKNHGLYDGEINYGWDIDHIIPISLAKTEEEILKLNHYTNLQPLCSYTNRHIKRNNLF
jgi:hypothetical protein